MAAARSTRSPSHLSPPLPPTSGQISVISAWPGSGPAGRLPPRHLPPKNRPGGHAARRLRPSSGRALLPLRPPLLLLSSVSWRRAVSVRPLLSSASRRRTASIRPCSSSASRRHAASEQLRRRPGPGGGGFRLFTRTNQYVISFRLPPSLFRICSFLLIFNKGAALLLIYSSAIPVYCCILRRLALASGCSWRAWAGQLLPGGFAPAIQWWHHEIQEGATAIVSLVLFLVFLVLILFG